MDDSTEMMVKIIFSIAILALMLARELAPGVNRTQAGALLGIAALLGIGAYFNLGTFHGQRFAHHWDQFHYALGAKYFPELGYDGLYVASIEAQLEVYPHRPVQDFIRDLRTNEVVRTRSPATVAHRQEVRARFDPGRWREFVGDHRLFLEANGRGYLAKIRKDHGFNPPPSWTFIARLFVGWVPLTAETVTAMGMLDVALLAALFYALHSTFGSRLTCLCLAFFGVNYAGRFDWIGGGLLREDWLAAVVIGICLLERGRFRWAGALLGYAAAVRLFPVLFLLGPGVLAIRALWRRQRPRWVLELGSGFAIALALALGAGCLVGRGPAAWTEFAEAITLHRASWLTNNVGLDNVLLYGPDTFKLSLVDFDAPEPRSPWHRVMEETKEKRLPLLLVTKAFLLLLLVATAWRLDLARSAMLGLVAIFTIVLATCYYWQMLLLVPLLRDRALLYGVFLLNLGLLVLHLNARPFEVRYGVMSWGLLILFLAYLAPKAWTTLRARGEREAEPEPIS